MKIVCDNKIPFIRGVFEPWAEVVYLPGHFSFPTYILNKLYNTDMKNEIEAKFLDIDKDAIRSKLESLGATLVKPETLMRRTVFNTGEHSFARVRDEGDKIVMTYKNVSDDHSILGTKEVNIEVNNYDG